MRSRMTLRPVVAVVAAALLLVGCTPRGVDIPLEASNIRPCDPLPDPYPVEQIDDTEQAECDLAGETIVFPDGYEMSAPSLGFTRSEGTLPKGVEQAPVYHVFNFGAFGLVAGRLSADGERSDWWGTEEGLRRYQAVRGTDVPPLSDD